MWPRIIPSLLLCGGRLVKGRRFAEYQDAGRPDTTARAHNAQGADELLLLDIQGWRSEEGPDVAAIRQVASECYMPLTVGGGVDSLDKAHRVMDAGADKICLTAPALESPDLIEKLAYTYGSQAVVLGVDVCRVDGTLALYDHRTRQVLVRDPLAWIDAGIGRGAGEIRLMSVEREGGRQGMDIDLLTRVLERVQVPVILEGGAGAFEHVAEAIKAGASGVGLGALLVFSDANIVKIKRFLANSGLELRL